MKYIISLVLGVALGYAQITVVTSTQKKFFSTSDPGIVTNSRSGDIFFNTNTRNIWTCANPTSWCTAIGAGNWTQITWNYTPLNPANNLSDVANATTARNNLGAQAAISGAPGTWPSFATVATTGAYNDLTGKPTLGTAAAQNVEAFEVPLTFGSGSGLTRTSNSVSITSIPAGAAMPGGLAAGDWADYIDALVSGLPIANGGTGATTAAGARTKLGLSTVSVLDYGADNTGATSSAAAFTSALAAQSPGGCVYVPGGVYSIGTSTITLGPGKCLRGEGLPRINYSGSGNAFHVTAGGSAAINVVIEGLEISGPGIASTATGIYLQNAWYGAFRDMYIHDFLVGINTFQPLVNQFTRIRLHTNATGVRLDNSANDNQFRDLSIQGATIGILIMNASAGNSIMGGDIQSNSTGIKIEDSSANIISDVWFEANAVENIRITSTGTVTDGTRVVHNTFADTKGMTVHAGSKAFVSGNYIPGAITVGSSATNTYIGVQSTLGSISDSGQGTQYFHDAAEQYVKSGAAKRYTVKVGASNVRIGSDAAVIVENAGPSGGIYRADSTSDASGSIKIGVGNPNGSVTARGGSLFVSETDVPYWSWCCVGNSHWYPLPIGTISTKTSAYSVVATDLVILADTTSSSFSVTLPASPITGKTYIVKKVSASNTLTIDGNGKNIDGSSTMAITANNWAHTLEYDGASWRVIAAYRP